MAQEFEAELHLVHVVEPPVYQNVLTSQDAANGRAREPILGQLTDKLARMVPAEAKNWCDLKTILREGKPDEELTRYAEVNDMDLIVLGVRGHGSCRIIADRVHYGPGRTEGAMPRAFGEGPCRKGRDIRTSALSFFLDRGGLP